MNEQMTLEQVRDALLELAESFDKAFPGARVQCAKWADAIDAHLNVAKGESVEWWCAIESVEAIDGTEEIAMSWNADDGNTGEAARTEANQWINDQPHPGNFRLAKIYAHPALPEVVRDAERYRWLRKKICFTGNGDGTASMHAINLPDSTYFPDMEIEHAVDKAIDAAMAAREGGE